MNFTRERRDEVIAKAQAIVDAAKAAGRGLTDDERTEVGGHLTEAKSINEALAGDAKAREVLDGLAGGGRGIKRGTLDDGRRLTFGAKGARVAAAAMLPQGTKAPLAASGSAVVGLDFAPDPIALGRAATGLLDVLPVIEHTSPVFRYLRQTFTGRTNNAAVVADGALKPTSSYTVEPVDAQLSVIAAVTDGTLNRYWLLDNSALATFLEAEMSTGLNFAVEAKILADINAQSGIQTQVYATSPLVTIRKALTKIEAAGLVAGAIVLNPNDFETLELMVATTNAVERLSLPFDSLTRRLFGVPIATTVRQAVGVAHILATDAVAVGVDTLGTQLDWSETFSADSFARNNVMLRAELRAATQVPRPFGICKATLAAA